MRSHARRLASVGLLIVVLGAVPYANVRVPTDPPFYARIERGPGGEPAVFNDGEWAVIPFYRHSGCVPTGFNLLDLFDLGAFGCHLRVTGFEIWKSLPPPPGGAPIQVQLFGLDGMEIWFVRWNEVSAAMADDILTIGELQTLPSLLRGTAELFKETLHPGGGARQSVLQMGGSGTLQDGRSFRFSAVDTNWSVRSIRIEID